MDGEITGRDVLVGKMSHCRLRPVARANRRVLDIGPERTEGDGFDVDRRISVSADSIV